MKTKKVLYATLVFVIVSLLSVAPVFASDGEPCPHSAPTVLSLRACVEHAVGEDHIDNQGVAKSLVAKLDAAQAAVDRRQKDVAVVQLEAFLQEVEAQAGKHIDAMHADHMIMHAQEVISVLRG